MTPAERTESSVLTAVQLLHDKMRWKKFWVYRAQCLEMHGQTIELQVRIHWQSQQSVSLQCTQF